MPEKALAKILAGDRTNGVQGSVWYDDSVYSFGYAGFYDRGRDYWNAGTKTVVNLWKSDTQQKYSDRYYVSGYSSEQAASNKLIYGTTTGSKYIPLTNTARMVWQYEDWDFAVVRIYHSAMNEGKLTYNQKLKVAAHEVGHSIKMDHPIVSITSIMNEGAFDIYDSIVPFDLNLVKQKWEAPQ